MVVFCAEECAEHCIDVDNETYVCKDRLCRASRLMSTAAMRLQGKTNDTGCREDCFCRHGDGGSWGCKGALQAMSFSSASSEVDLEVGASCISLPISCMCPHILHVQWRPCMSSCLHLPWTERVCEMLEWQRSVGEGLPVEAHPNLDATRRGGCGAGGGRSR